MRIKLILHRWWPRAVALLFVAVFLWRSVWPGATALPSPPVSIPAYLPVMSAIFFGGLTGFLYFLNQWVLQRLSAVSDYRTIGNPLIICWINIVGTLMTCLVGMHYCMTAYLSEMNTVNLLRSLLLAPIAIPAYCLLLILFQLVGWFFSNRRCLEDSPGRVSFDGLPSWRIVLAWSIPSFFPFGLLAFNEGPPLAAIFLLATLVFGAFGVGAYAAFWLDYGPRAIGILRGEVGDDAGKIKRTDD